MGSNEKRWKQERKKRKFDKAVKHERGRLQLYREAVLAFAVTITTTGLMLWTIL